MKGGAIFSECGTWRYSLTRTWDGTRPRLCFVMLNPSTADSNFDDPTTKKVLRLAMTWQFGHYEAVNLFAYRSPHPRDLIKVEGPVGPDNDQHILNAVDTAHLVVVAWGTKGILHCRDLKVLELLRGRQLHCLGLTMNGHPKFPLYLKESGLKAIKFK